MGFWQAVYRGYGEVQGLFWEGVRDMLMPAPVPNARGFAGKSRRCRLAANFGRHLPGCLLSSPDAALREPQIPPLFGGRCFSSRADGIEFRAARNCPVNAIGGVSISAPCPVNCIPFRGRALRPVLPPGKVTRFFDPPGEIRQATRYNYGSKGLD